MKVFIVALDEGSLARAGRKLGRSPAAVSRAIAFLEARVGVELLHRTTRSIKLSEAGERYAVTCRRVLIDLEDADATAAGERSAPRGSLTLTAPVRSGEMVLRPILDAFLDAYPAVSARLYLFDSRLNLIEKPGDLAKHRIIAMTHWGLDSWSFPPLPGSSVPRAVQFTPRLIINSVSSQVASAVGGHGVTRCLSYQVAEQVRAGELEIILAGDEYPPLPVRLIAPQGRLAMPKVRAFMDFAVPRLRNHFGRLAVDTDTRRAATRS